MGKVFVQIPSREVGERGVADIQVAGSAGAYMKIFELNQDQLTDPNKIKPGQVLRLP